MPYWIRLLIALVLNFLALFMGSSYTYDGVRSEWYMQLHQAPWTPPNYVFAVAWTLVMICLGFYMAGMTRKDPKEPTNPCFALYGVQWILNVLWNPVFFDSHATGWALTILLLMVIPLVGLIYLGFREKPIFGILALPYLIWIGVAISLNAYIYMKN